MLGAKEDTPAAWHKAIVMANRGDVDVPIFSLWELGFPICGPLLFQRSSARGLHWRKHWGTSAIATMMASVSKTVTSLGDYRALQ